MLVERDLENHDAVVLLLRDSIGRFLCLYHNKFDFWTVPLGKTEEGQSPEQAAVAEAQEELGIEVTKLSKRYQGTRVYCRQGHYIVTFFHLFEITEYRGSPQNMEPGKHASMKFLSTSELRDLPRTSDGTVMLLTLLEQLNAIGPPAPFGEMLPAAAKVGLAGASGAGKTTVANRLVTRHGGRLHPESVRKWLKDNGDLRYSTLDRYQFRELQLHLLAEYETSNANIFDRCPLDSIYYASRVDDLLDSAFRQRALKLLREYSAVFFFPPRSDYLIDDGVRIADLKHQTEVAARMLIDAYEAGLEDKIIIYDHCRSIDENLCELFSFIRKSEH